MALRSRTSCLAAAAGPVLALVLWTGYALYGRSLVQALYDGRMPLTVLNEIVTGQETHPVEYHLARAGKLVRRLALLLTLWGPLCAGWLAWARRHPQCWLAQTRIGALLLSTVTVWLLYLLRVPLFEVLPGWFWPLRTKSLPYAWVFVPLTAVMAIAAHQVLRWPGRPARNLALLIGVAFVAHHALAWAEGPGAMAARLTDTGHSVFAQAAVEGPDTWSVLTRYDELLATGELPTYFHATKPPGLQVVTNLTAAVSGRLWPHADPMQALARLATLVYPLLGLLTLVPLYALANVLLDKEGARLPALLFPVVPGVALIQLHADQYLHPLLGTVFVYLCTRALFRREPLTGVLAGVAFVLSLWISFALLALAPVVPVMAWSLAKRHGRRSVLRELAMMAAGAAAVYLFLLLAFGYDTFERWEAAMVAHRMAKLPGWDLGDRAYFAAVNLLEFAVWCAPPVILLCAADSIRLFRHRAWRAPRPADGLTLSLLAILAALALGGTTAAESARLWLFLVPLVTVAAARSLQRWAPENLRTATGVVVALQWGTVIVLKYCQDFM